MQVRAPSGARYDLFTGRPLIPTTDIPENRITKIITVALLKASPVLCQERAPEKL